MLNITNLRAELRKKANPKKAKFLQKYFRTGKGEYGEGDVFIGLAVPEIRKIAKKYKHLKLSEIQQLLKSKFHEERLAALLILVEQFNQSQGVVMYHNNTGLKQSVVINHHTPSKHSVMLKHNISAGKQIFEFYLKNTKYINNWDLVDLSAPKIVGEYFLRGASINGSTAGSLLLRRMARSKNLWERRIAVLATFAFIKEGQFSESLKIAEMLLNDKHDLIHKAVGWMLREVGKRSQPTLEKFLKKYASKMPRVMLRYAIERLPKAKRRFFIDYY